MIEGKNYRVYLGDSLEVLPLLPDNSVDSIVTDPPYEISFMSKSWDSSGIAYNVDLWRECLRVLKPGGHLLAFSSPRTYHRMVVAIEDSGFEIRDMISWISNKTFPKSHNLKGEWQGWGTGLKPTVEPIVMARKPLIGTVAENVLTYGTGALNIDGSRIGTEKRKNNINDFSNQHGNNFGNGEQVAKLGESEVEGRWPANVILDEYSAGLLDEQSGDSKSPKTYLRNAGTLEGDRVACANIGEAAGTESKNYGDSGGASRFFYVAKASKRDRNEGLEDLEDSGLHKWNGSEGHRGVGDYYPDGTPRPVNPMKNFHPTVKPTALMRYLVKLVTPPGGTVLDPFTGSGSTGKAALLDGFQFLGVELTEDYLPIIKGRLDSSENKSEQELF